MKSKSLMLIAAAASVAFTACQKGLIQKNSGAQAVERPKATEALDASSTAFFKRTTGAVSFDQAASVHLASGRTLWLNGDTFYNDWSSDGTTPCLFGPHNSVMTQASPTTWTVNSAMVLNGTNPQLFNVSGSSTDFYWPSNGTESATANTIFIHVQQAHPITGGVSIVGQAIATLKVTGTTPSFSSVTITPITTALNGIDFDMGMARGLDGYIYLYGYKYSSFPLTNLYLARFNPVTPATLSFYIGAKSGDVNTASNWGSSATSATVIGNGVSAGMNVSFVKSKWVLINTAYNDQTVCPSTVTGIYASSSTVMTGFPAVAKIYDITDKLGTDRPFFYTPELHPECNDSSTFLFTYCINEYSACTPSCNSGRSVADYYRPRGVRIAFTTLGL